jgi:hypothetical protein
MSIKLISPWPICRRGKGTIDGKEEGKGLKEGADAVNLLLAGVGEAH